MRGALLVVVATFIALGAAGVWAGYEVVHYPSRPHAGTQRTRS